MRVKIDLARVALVVALVLVAIVKLETDSRIATSLETIAKAASIQALLNADVSRHETGL